MHTLHDPELLPQSPEWLFSPEALAARGLISARSSGRRSAFTFSLHGQAFVLRHFWRGGLIGRLLQDSYLWTGYARSRPVREWRLLTQLSAEGLPVPRPAALRICRRGLSYRADLITVRLPAAHTLADHLQHGALEEALWRKVGAAIAQVHRRGAYHADLNARNILLGETEPGAVYLIDWDRGRLRRPARSWQRRNLARLRRSLEKLAGRLSPFHYSGNEFEHLLDGYLRAGSN